MDTGTRLLDGLFSYLPLPRHSVCLRAEWEWGMTLSNYSRVEKDAVLEMKLERTLGGTLQGLKTEPQQ